MNAIKEMNRNNSPNEISEKKCNLSLMSNETWIEKVEVKKMTNEYLNEQLYYFYTNGGPIMDI